MAEQSTIAVKLTPLGLAEVVRALRQVQSEAKDLATKTESVFSRVRSRLGGLLPTIGLTAAATAVGLFITRITEFQDAMGKAGARVGSSAENFSVLAFAARTAEVSVEEVEIGLGRLARNVSEFTRGGGEARTTFEALGLSAKDFAGNDTVQAFDAIAQRLGKLPAGVDKTRLAIELLGRGGARLIPLLNDVAEKGFAQIRAEAESFGALVRGDTAEAAERFNDDLERLKIGAQRAGRSLLADMLPALNEITAAMAEAAKQSGILSAAAVGIGGIFALIAGDTDAQRLTAAAKNVEALEKQVASYQALLKKGATDAGKLFGFTVRPSEQLNERQINATNAKLFENIKLLEDAKRKLAELQKQQEKPKKKEAADELGIDFDAAKRIAELTKQIGGEEIKRLADLQKKRDTISALELQNAQRTAEARATTQAQQDRIEFDALRRREQLIKQGYAEEINLARAREQALSDLVAKTTPRGRTATELQAQVAKQSFDQQLAAATTYYQKLSQLQAEYVTRYKQSQDRVKAIDQELADSRVQREKIIQDAARATLTEEQKNEADLRRLRDARSELGSAVVRNAGVEVRKLNTEINELFARLASAPGFENVSRRITDETQSLFETFLRVEKGREQALGKEAAEGIKKTNQELERTKTLSAELEKQSALTIRPTVEQGALRDLKEQIQKGLDEKPFRISVVPNIASGSGGVAGFAGGGRIPGVAPHARADNKIILATPGEFMHPVSAVEHYGLRFMEDVRSRRFPRFADGGLVGGNTSSGTAGDTDSMVIDLRSDGRQVASLRGGREEVRKFSRWLDDLQRGTVRR